MASSVLSTQPSQTQQQQWIPDERDAFILWIRGEFAAANAIIDALCQHLQVLSASSPTEYDPVLTCIQQRRYNWNPVLHMQQYFSVADVIFALQQVAMNKQAQLDPLEQPEAPIEKAQETSDSQVAKLSEESKNTNAEPPLDNSVVKSSSSPKRLSVPKFITGYEDIDGQQLNVMEGLRLYDGVFDSSESERLSTLVAESHAKKRRKGNKKSKSRAKDMIHFGTIPSDVPAGPVFKEETPEPMPNYLESIIDTLVKSQIIPASKRPDGSSISVLEPGDYMPPHNHHHFEQPILVLSLGSPSTMTFGRNLKASANGDVDGKYKVTLSVGSILVLQGKSADLVQCAVPPSQTSRTLVTFGSMPKGSSKSKTAAAKRLSPPLRSLSISPVLTTMATAAASTVGATPIMLPISTSSIQTAATVVAAAVPYSPVAVVVPPTTTTRVPNPGTGVFLPANGGTAVYNAQHQMHGRRHHYHHHDNHFHAGRKELVA